MKIKALVALAVLLLMASVIAANASIIYQDNFQTNDYGSRYTTWNAWKDGWWPNDFTYVDLGAGSIGFAPSAGWWSSAIDTKDYLNGHFTNTSYVATVAMKSPTATLQPYFGFGLLNNGVTSSQSSFKGYYAQFCNNGGKVALILGRTNADGSGVDLVTNLSTPFENADLAQWSTLTATVDVQAAGTYLKMAWAGVDALGAASSYSCDYLDTSAERWTTGTGLGLFGWGGANAPAFSGNPSAVTVDNLVVSTVPEPSSFVAFGCGLISLLGMKRRRA